MFARFLIYFLVPVALVACGGESDDPSWGPLTSGVLEGPVTGLRYDTGSESGLTDENGTFSYRTGQQVRFYVGDILVGSARGAASLTLFDLAGLDAPPVAATEVRATINQMAALPFATPFEATANIAALLYTLDEDNNTSNGIVIPAAMHSVATGPAINFGLRRLSFADQYPLRKLLADAHSASVWPDDRPLLHNFVVMDALYASLGLVPEIYVATRVDIDNGDNGSIDDVITASFDGNGLIYDDFRDTDNDGNVDIGAEFRYDASGNRTSFTVFIDGVPEYTHLYFYDDRGFGTRTESTYAATSGLPDKVTVYTRDNYGSVSAISEDIGADGSIDAVTYVQYDVHGLMQSIDKDTDNDSTIESRDIFYYDSRGRLVQLDSDVNALGVPAQIGKYTRNAYDQNLVIRFDFNADGNDDMIDSYQYNGRQQQTRLAQDFGADGSVETYYYWRYDANGYLLEAKTRDNVAGTYRDIALHTRDALGNELTRKLDHEGDGTFEHAYTYTYDANGNLTESVRDANDDGTIDSRNTYTYQKISRWGTVFPTHQ